MSVLGLFIVFVASTVLFWLSRQGLLNSPWLEEGENLGAPNQMRIGGVAPPPAAKVALAIFLAVAGCLFSLLTAAYFMRMDSADWQNPPVPSILWVNTTLLVASSAALQWALFAVRRGEMGRTRALLLVGAASAVLFLCGQLWAWSELKAEGFYLASNPANAFFYLLTGIHGLHLIGGLVALARTLDKAFRGGSRAGLETSIELCAIYWHFLFLVWLMLFAMLAGGMNEFGVLCRRLLS
jgi:cytochrome c oxidase subunit 3